MCYSSSKRGGEDQGVPQLWGEERERGLGCAVALGSLKERRKRDDQDVLQLWRAERDRRSGRARAPGKLFFLNSKECSMAFEPQASHMLALFIG